MRTLISRLALLALALSPAACGGDEGGSFSPSVDNVAGSYSALSFTITSGAGTTDLRAIGATVSVALEVNGTTTGRLFVPGGGENGADLDADLTGTWTLTGNTVTFHQAGGSFLDGATFTATQNRLSSEGVFQGSTISLVLGKPS